MSTASPLAVALEDVASCFEGIIPASICTCSRDGTPNVTYLSIVHRVDSRHVGLSYQFFNKTRENMLQNPFVQVVVVSTGNLRQYRLDLRYERTETEGAVFDRMRARLDAVASQTGMSQIFKLRGVDIFEVMDCRPLNAQTGGEGLSRVDYLPQIEEFTARLAACQGLESLINVSLDALSELFGYTHSFFMVPDEDGGRLFTLGSHGFGESGIGSEVWLGEGILGVAAERREVVRTTNFSRDVLYSKAVRSSVERHGEDSLLEQEIALPGLPQVESQLVVPLVSQDRLLGILCLQSAIAGRILSGDERVVRIAARHMAASMAALERTESTELHETPRRIHRGQPTFTSTVKHYKADDSIFIDDAYLIKGIAGRILWKLLQSYAQRGRVDFTNREIRLDTSLRLPDIKDNLEARLILLRRRLQDRCDFVSLNPVGRGQFRLDVQRQLTLEERL
ncbi:MAG TPA: GAF domain-containing protein [Bryobacteraceae bacterium]|nr:GAF domain-containing protein [Bryobacteraceae bacterium]